MSYSLFFSLKRVSLGPLYRSGALSCCSSRYISNSPIKPNLGKQPKLNLSKERPARTRFAPSPTGYLHLGSLRTALFNYIIAKATGGQFILRIEDTDQKRTILDSEEKIYRDLRWAGLQWDEGPDVGGLYGPYKQSKRVALHQVHAQKLLDSGHAYRCFCTAEELMKKSLLNQSSGMPVGYDRSCTHLDSAESEDRASKGEAHVIRLKLPDPYPQFFDLVHGKVAIKSQKNIGVQSPPVFMDPVLLKSDGFPTYHLANVVDDHYMKITHVVRGSEWMSSTPYHLALYKAFEWEAPEFAHVGLLVGTDFQKLSKRDGMSIMIESLRDVEGIYPEALLNFVAVLGASFPRKDDRMTLEEMIQYGGKGMKFTKGDAIVTFGKLDFFQQAQTAKLLESSPTNINEMITFAKKVLFHRDDGKAIIKQWESILAGRDGTEYIEDVIRSSGGYISSRNYIKNMLSLFTLPDEQVLINRLPQFKERIKRSILLRDEEVPWLEMIQEVEKIPFSPTATMYRPLKTTATEANTALDENRSSLQAEHTDTNIGNANWNALKILRATLQEENKLEENEGEKMAKRLAKMQKLYYDWAIGLYDGGPGPRQFMCLLGPVETIRRLKMAAEILRKGLDKDERFLLNADEIIPKDTQEKEPPAKIVVESNTVEAEPKEKISQMETEINKLVRLKQILGKSGTEVESTKEETPPKQ